MPRIADPDNLRLAFWKAAKGKEGKREVEAFRSQLDFRLGRLREEFLTGDVALGDYHYFTIYDPKERTICAAPFPERVLHHALMNICHDSFEKFQVFDSYATRKGKGTYAALHRAEQFHRKYSWYLKLDVRKYFASINHSILIQMLERRFKDQALLRIFSRILDSYPADHCENGLPIGNLTSQYFANHYLAPGDRFVKHEIRVPAYLRYMDDMVMWSNDKAELLVARDRFRAYLAEHLKLSLKIEELNKTAHGMNFVGYRLFPGYTRLSRRSKKRLEKRLCEGARKLALGDWDEAEYQRRISSVLSFVVDHAQSKALRNRILGEGSNRRATTV